VVVIIFLAILTAGFVFELGKNALSISSRQSHSLNSIYVSPPRSAEIKSGFKGSKDQLNLTHRRSYSTSSYRSVKLSNFKPAAIYANAKQSKKIIMQENKGQGGIYR
jgi:hypothetical protein